MGITFESIERMDRLGLFGKGRTSILDIGSSNLYSANPEQIKRFLNTLLLRHQTALARGFGEVARQHLLGQAGQTLVQGFAVAMRAGATKEMFDTTIGVHPSAAEEFVTMREPTRR